MSSVTDPYQLSVGTTLRRKKLWNLFTVTSTIGYYIKKSRTCIVVENKEVSFRNVYCSYVLRSTMSYSTFLTF